MKSIKPNKQRKDLYTAPIHIKRKRMSSHLEENLLLKYDTRSLPVIKGDTVKVMRGSFRGHEDKVANVNVKKNIIEIEGITMAKADGNKIAKPLHPSNVLITKLNLTDKWRRKKLEKGLSEEAKKELEREAAQQIKEAEEEQKRLEEELAAKEAEEAEKIEEETIEEQPVEEEKPIKKETKPKEKAPAEKPKTAKKTTKKSTPKKTTEKKTTAKKTTTKTVKKEEEK